jgi:hypothetical protein
MVIKFTDDAADRSDRYFEKMPTQYPQEAVDLCRKIYCKYGGNNADAIEREMRKVYPGWRRNNLNDRGKGKEARLGWVTKYGFEKSLEIYNRRLTEAVNDDEQDLYIGIQTVRKTLQEKVHAKTATKDEFYQYRDFCKLEIEARKNLDLSRDNFDTFVAGWEKILGWLGELDPKAVKMLVKHGEKLTELAQAHYGKSEEIDAGTSDREDESSD